MPRRQPRPLPRLWLMTDERQGDGIWDAIARLPRGGGIVFRHYRTPSRERRDLFDRIRRIARRRGLVLILAGDARQAAGWRADGVHGTRHRRSARPLIRTAPAHDRREIAIAQKTSDLLFVSPVFPTRSHPGAPTLGRVRFAALAGAACKPVVALGGMDAARVHGLTHHHGWAAIDAWTER